MRLPLATGLRPDRAGPAGGLEARARRRPPGVTLLVAAAAAGAGLAIVVFVVVAARRAGSPSQLEWLEGGMVEQVGRVLHGRSLYPAPSIDNVAYPYPPLYIWVSALVARVTGLGYLPLRLVSIGASLASIGLLYTIVEGEAGRLGGLVAAGLFAAAFRFTGGFYDVARVDALFMALVLASVLVAFRARRGRLFAAAGVLLALATLAKESAFIAGIPVAVWLLVRPGARPRDGLAFMAGAVLPVAAVGAWLQAASSGWFATDTLGVLVGHGVDPTWWVGFWTSDLMPTLLPEALLGAVAVAWRRRERWGVLFAAAAGMVASSYVSRLHSASSENVLIPVAAAGALVSGLAVGWLARRGWPAQAGLALLCLAQFGLLAYSPAAQLPPASQVVAARRLEAVVRELPGDVLVVSHPWEVTVTGKGTHAHAGAIADVVRSRDARTKRALLASISRAVAAERFSVLAFDNDQDYAGFPADLARWYRPVPPPAGLGPPAARSLQTPFVGHPTQWWVARRLATNPVP